MPGRWRCKVLIRSTRTLAALFFPIHLLAYVADPKAKESTNDADEATADQEPADAIIVIGHRHEAQRQQQIGQSVIITPSAATRFDSLTHLKRESSFIVSETGHISPSGFALPKIRGQDIKLTEVYLAGSYIKSKVSIFLARQLNDIVPNPWISFELGERALKLLGKKYSKEEITDNFIFIIEELKKILEAERDRLSEDVFKKMLETKKLFFFLLKEEGQALIPSRIRVNGKMQLNRTSDNKAVQKSLFDEVVEEDYDTLEKEVAVYLDEQEKLLWWYRNISRQNYHIQGWKEHKIYPDFIATKKDKTQKDYYETVYVLETKGIHLKGNDKTTYIENVFKLCKELGVKEPWAKLFNEFPDHNFEFQVIYGNEWADSINQIMK